MILALALIGFARASMAQGQGCTYDTCALRLHRGFMGPRIVRGVTGEKVAGFGLFAPRLSLFAERSDSAARYYELFRKSNNQGNALALVGTAIFLAATFSRGTDWSQPVTTAQGVGLAIGAGFTLAGAIRLHPSHNRLSKAIWWYNRTLAGSSGP
jgi:hypothetical protein